MAVVRVKATRITPATLEAEIEIGGLFEVAEMLGVSRQRAYQLALKPWWPEPIQLKSARLYDLVEVREVLRERGRNV